jgi:hypothetical protein
MLQHHGTPIMGLSIDGALCASLEESVSFAAPRESDCKVAARKWIVMCHRDGETLV